METGRLIESLARGGKAFEALLGGVSDDLAGWKPGPSDWSLLEIACHMLDEEREDFRARLSTSGDAINIRMNSDDPSFRDLMGRRTEALRAGLSAQGLNVANVAVGDVSLSELGAIARRYSMIDESV